MLAAASFGEYLRGERLARRVTLEQLEAHSKIARPLLEGLERNDFSRFPPERFYREHLIRAYAAAVGLDPQLVVERFRREFPAAPSLPIVVETPPRSRMWIALSAFSVALIVAISMVFTAIDRESASSPGRASGTAGDGSTEEARPSFSAEEPPTPPAGTASETGAVPDPVEPPMEDVEGELMITSTPPGVRVTVNGIYRGETPVRVLYLPVGTYTIRFIGDGDRTTDRRVTITPSRRVVKVSATLPPRSRELQ